MPKKTTKGDRKEFLRLFQNEYYSVRAICKTIQIGKSTFYRWLQNPRFKQEVEKIKKRRKINRMNFKQALEILKRYGGTNEFLQKYQQGGMY